MQHDKYIKIINILIFLLLIINPILDIYWFNNSYAIKILGVTVPTIIRLLIFFIILILYMLKTRNIKNILTYSAFIAVYLVFQYLNCNDYNNYSLVKEFRYMVILALPLLLGYIVYKIDIDKKKLNKAFVILASLYSLFIIIPTIFGFAIGSYKEEVITAPFLSWFTNTDYNYIDLSSRGILYWAIIAASFLSLIPIMFLNFVKSRKSYYLLLIFTLSLSCLMIGTRASSIGVILTLIVLLLIYLFFTLICKHLKFDKEIFFKYVIALLSILVVFSYSPVNSHIKMENDRINIKDSNLYKIKDNGKVIDCTKYPESFIIKKVNELEKIFFNERFMLVNYKLEDDPVFWCTIINNTKILEQSDNRFIEEKILQRLKEINNNYLDDFLGLGYSTTSNVYNLEKDFIYQYYNIGIIGSLLTVAIYPISIIVLSLIILIKKKLNIYNCSLILSLGLFVFFAYYSGNTLGSLGVTILEGVILGLLYKEVFEPKNLKEKKVTILALHLGGGGVEKFISSLSKMLEEKYDVEIISSYKVSDKPVFYFSNNIKITYLINDRPYKNEFIMAIKNKRVLQIIQYGLKNVKILLLKYIKERKAILNIDSKYVITTIFHSKKCGHLLNDDYIKIATEHNYHNNNNEYIKKVVKSVKKFDALVLVSDDLYKFYKDKVDCKCIFIPNVIDNIPNIKYRKKKNTLISVGRLSHEKGFLDLIDVINLVKKDNPDIKLNIIGEGPQRDELQEKIKKLKLEKNISLLGFMSHEDVNYQMQKANLYVMTSYTESFGLVLIEAMSNKLACIAFDSANGAKGLLRDSIGILIKDRNKEDMAKKIVRVLNDTKGYEEKGYEFSKKFLIGNVKKSWYDLLGGLK